MFDTNEGDFSKLDFIDNVMKMCKLEKQRRSNLFSNNKVIMSSLRMQIESVINKPIDRIVDYIIKLV